MAPAKLSFEEIQNCAKQRGGECLSSEYINARTKLKWRCNEGHTWKATFNSVKYMQSWCNECAKKARPSHRLNIIGMREIAKERGGECLSSEYVNVKTKLKWQCHEGHIWETSPSSVKNSHSWCPVCTGFTSRFPSVDLEKLRQVARENGGRCLSTKYINAKTKLQWSCEKRHIWEATPNSVKNDQSWCPICGAKRRGRRKILSK